MKVPIFIQFLQRIVRDADAKVFLILDNLRVHHANKVQEWVAKNKGKIELFYLPPYCPELNPDEYLNNTVKAQLRNKPAPRSREQLKEKLTNRMKSNHKKPHLIKNCLNTRQYGMLPHDTF